MEVWKNGSKKTHPTLPFFHTFILLSAYPQPVSPFRRAEPGHCKGDF
jgi:hypothetical protein